MTEDTILQGDALETLKTLEINSVDCIITSPPYWGLRDYGIDGQLGLEKTPEEFIAGMVAVFEECRRVLKKNGTCWVNIGDSYVGTGNKTTKDAEYRDPKYKNGRNGQGTALNNKVRGLKSKDLVGIPWMLAFSLRNAGWYLLGRPAGWADGADHTAVGWANEKNQGRKAMKTGKRAAITGSGLHGHSGDFRPDGTLIGDGLANKRSVWSVPTFPYKEAHFATFPEELIEPMVLAGCPKGGIILDPFMGAGTTAVVAKKMGRKFLGIELNPEYIKLAERRIAGTPYPLF